MPLNGNCRGPAYTARRILRLLNTNAPRAELDRITNRPPRRGCDELEAERWELLKAVVTGLTAAPSEAHLKLLCHLAATPTLGEYGRGPRRGLGYFVRTGIVR
jgi:hypothetical protein